MRRSLLRLAVTTLTAAVVGAGLLPATASATSDRDGRCTPASQQLDPAAVREAITYANTHLRTSVQIFRNDCRVGRGLVDPVTEQVPYNVWSSTKGVVSLLTGIAYDQGALALDDPIGEYLPHGPGWGNAAHRAITVRQLLTQTSGLREAILAEAATVGTDPDIAQEALAQPITHEPGTHFEYSQRTPDLLAYVVERAVGEDLQAFAQRNLFGLIGIPADSYFWLRDRSGHTYGYAHLFIPPAQFAKLGLLMQNGGSWHGNRVLSTRYLDQARQPTRTNGCYGFLMWVNAGRPCTGSNIPKAQTVDRVMIPSAPRDLYAMVGALQQNNFVIPSLHMTVTWTGVLGDTSPNLSDLASASPGGDLYHEFFRILMRGVRDKDIPDPGPYRAPPLDLDVNPLNYADPRVLLTDLAPNPHCNLLVCRA